MSQADPSESHWAPPTPTPAAGSHPPRSTPIGSSPIGPAPTGSVPIGSASAQGEPAVTARRPNPLLQIAIFGCFGAFVWTVIGVVGWGAASGFGPRVTEDAQILSVEFERGGTASTTSRGSWWVEGETESGRTWRIASDEAYEAASSQGYPMDVEVVVSTWTGSTLAVRGDGFDVDRGGGAFRVLWLVTATVGVVIAVGLAWLLARKESLLAVVSFTVCSPLWVWLGFVFMRAYRT